MHRILMREVVVNAPAETFAQNRDFWAAALAADAEQVVEFSEFTGLRNPASLSWVGLQEIDSGEARFHLDIETDDVAAEVVRLIGLGGQGCRRPDVGGDARCGWSAVESSVVAFGPVRDRSGRAAGGSGS